MAPGECDGSTCAKETEVSCTTSVCHPRTVLGQNTAVHQNKNEHAGLHLGFNPERLLCMSTTVSPVERECHCLKKAVQAVGAYQRMFVVTAPKLMIEADCELQKLLFFDPTQDKQNEH
ncbi:unnamed protein product, partial [Ectocarpus sp. 13 AM-2016]